LSVSRRPEREAPAALRGPWMHSSSGIAYPRGSMLVYLASDEDYVRLEDGSERRGAREADRLSTHVRRSLAHQQQLEAFCAWLAGYAFDILGTVTYSDEYAERYNILSMKAAIRDVRAAFNTCR